MSAVLALRDIHKDFSGVKVIQGVDLEIAEGERHAIIGPNGAGKTTLMNIITGKYAPSRGTVFFHGSDITKSRPYQRARVGIGRCFQIINVFWEMTVFENIRNGVLAQRGNHWSMRHRISRMQDVNEKSEEIVELFGLQSARNQVAAALPYGMQRSLEIALALSGDPKLVILDEPAAGISAEETRSLTDLITRTVTGRTLILIEHDMDVVFAVADRISVLHYGEIISQGPPDEVRADEKVKEVYLGTRGST